MGNQKLICVEAPANTMFIQGNLYNATDGHGYEGCQYHLTDELGHTRVIGKSDMRFLVGHTPVGGQGLYAKFANCLGPEDLTKEQQEILQHTRYRAARNMYCGDSPDMQVLVAHGLMTYAGQLSFVPDKYFKLTKYGTRVLKDMEAAEAAESKTND